MSTPPPVDEIFFAALEKASPEERSAYLNEACRDNPELRLRVEKLLDAHPAAERSSDQPVAGFQQTVDRRKTGAEGDGWQFDGGESVGTLIAGRYKLLEQIAEGGMGTVWVAQQIEPVRRRVALKLIKPGMDSRQVLSRFEAERQALALMDHPSIAKVFDGGITEQGRPFFVMEYVKGIPLTDFCDQARLSVPDRLTLFIQVCNAVQHAHQKGIIHRDLKPSNILVCRYDDRAVPKVIDFGLAKAMHQPLTERTLYTAHGLMVGTPLYMSPEQAEFNNLDIDTRSDVYSLGVILYELLTGTTPLDRERFKDAALHEIIRLIKEEEPMKPSTKLSSSGSLPSIAAQRSLDPAQLRRAVRGDLDWIVMKSLEKDRARRYDSASAMAAEVTRYLADEPVIAAGPTTIYRIQKFVRRYRAQVAVALVILALLVVGVAASTLGLIWALRAERLVREQNDFLAEERDRVVTAEHTAQQEKLKAEAEAHRARQQYADSLISNGDALVSAGEFQAAYNRFAKAAGELQSLDESCSRLDLSLVRLYRASPPPLWTATIPGGEPRAWALLPARKELLVAGGDDQFHAIDLCTGATLRTFGDAHGIECMAVASPPDGPVVVVGGPRFAHVIDPITGAIVREANDDRATTACALSPDGLLAASVDQKGSIIFWNVATLARVSEGRHGKEPKAVAFSHDGAMVSSVCNDNTIALWQPRTGTLIRRFKESPGRRKIIPGCDCVGFSADDQSVVCGEAYGVIAGLSVEGKSNFVWHVPEGSINSIEATPEGKRWIAATADGTIHIFEREIADDRPTLTLVNPTAQPVKVWYIGTTSPSAHRENRDLSPADGGVAVAIDARGVALAWPLVSPHRPKERSTGGMSISRDGLLISRGGMSLSVEGVALPGNGDHRRDVGDAATGRTLRLLRQSDYSNCSAFSADSQHLYNGTDDGNLTAFDLIHNRCEWAVHAHDRGQVWSISTSADNAVAVSGGNDPVARAWDARAGSLLAALPGQGSDVRVIAFAPPDGEREGKSNPPPGSEVRRVIVGPSEQPFITEWRLGPSAGVRRIPGVRTARGFAFSPDGKLLAVGDNSKSIAILDAATLLSVRSLAPVRTLIYAIQFIDPGAGPGKWVVSSGRGDLGVWDIAAGEEKLVLDNASGYGINTMVASADGSLIFANVCGRIDLTIPRRMRKLSQRPSTIARAELYSCWGLWSWVEELLDREQAAGRDVPALLAARAHWMCGKSAAARKAFDLAVARGEVPAWYADLCMSATDGPPTIDLLPAADRPPDPKVGPK